MYDIQISNNGKILGYWNGHRVQTLPAKLSAEMYNALIMSAIVKCGLKHLNWSKVDWQDVVYS